MTIVLPEPYQLDPVQKFEAEVEWLIQSSIEQEEGIGLSELVEMIRDAAFDLFSEMPPARPGPPLAAIREWQERHRNEQNARSFAAIESMLGAARLPTSKPRIRVRAATQHSA